VYENVMGKKEFIRRKFWEDDERANNLKKKKKVSAFAEMM